MNKIKLIALSVLVVSAILASGYWLGAHQNSGAAIEHSAAKDTVQPEILYYRNPMGLPDTSPVPKKDSMGMDYVAVYEGDAAREDGAIDISVARVQKLGVKSEAVMLRRLDRTLRVTGVITVNERLTYAIAPKFEGWVEKLYVNTSGQAVSKGQPLFDVYSPELVSAQREYAIALQGESALKEADSDARGSMKQLADASLARLKNWDIPGDEIKRAAHDHQVDGKSARNLTYYSPVSGVVMEKRAVQGMRFMPGETLYQIADLSSIWVLADIPEQDIGQVKLGAIAQVSLDAYPAQSFEGRVAFIYPALNTATRTVQVRIEIANPKGLLKPSMYARVTLPVGEGTDVLSVPNSAVIDSGTRQVVLVQLAAGRFAPRNVKLGNRGVDYVEVLEGLQAGEQVVTSALFLIDAESNLKASLSTLAPNADSKPAAISDAGATVAVQPPAKAAGVGHQGQGVLDEIYEDGSVGITHEAIRSLGWPGMSMDFELANSSLIKGIKPGSKISFEIVERKPGEWVITRLVAGKKEH